MAQETKSTVCIFSASGLLDGNDYERICREISSSEAKDSPSSVMVLRIGIFSLFIPLKLRSAAQIDTATLLEPQISLGKSRGLSDREFRPESKAFHWALK